MAGKKWTRKELAQLKRHRKLGKTTREIYLNKRLLRGRSLHAIQQQCRRNAWVDKEASEACKKGRENGLSPAQTKEVCRLIRSNPKAPLHLYESTWNAWALKNDAPTITKGIAYYWLRKMGFKRSQREVYQSDIAKKERLRRRRIRFERKLEEFELQWELVLGDRLEQADIFRRRHTTVEDQVCSCCDKVWPLSKVFFSRLPSSFTFGGRKLQGFQTEFCRFCSELTTARLALYRYYNRSVLQILAMRLAQRRAGLDQAVELLVEKAQLARDRRFRRYPNTDVRECIRCEECWPLDKRHFRPNRGTADGEATFRALCVFCDGYFERNIDRCKRDGRSPRLLRAERAKYLAQARDAERVARRERARDLRDRYIRRHPTLWMEYCECCGEMWPTGGGYAGKFWNTNGYRRVSGELSRYINTRNCLFCISDRNAKKRR